MSNTDLEDFQEYERQLENEVLCIIAHIDGTNYALDNYKQLSKTTNEQNKIRIQQIKCWLEQAKTLAKYLD